MVREATGDLRGAGTSAGATGRMLTTSGPEKRPAGRQGDRGPVHRDVDALLQVAHRHPGGRQRALEGEAASEQEGHEVLAPELVQVAPPLRPARRRGRPGSAAGRCADRPRAPPRPAPASRVGHLQDRAGAGFARRKRRKSWASGSGRITRLAWTCPGARPAVRARPLAAADGGAGVDGCDEDQQRPHHHPPRRVDRPRVPGTSRPTYAHNFLRLLRASRSWSRVEPARTLVHAEPSDSDVHGSRCTATASWPGRSIVSLRHGSWPSSLRCSSAFNRVLAAGLVHLRACQPAMCTPTMAGRAPLAGPADDVRPSPAGKHPRAVQVAAASPPCTARVHGRARGDRGAGPGRSRLRGPITTVGEGEVPVFWACGVAHSRGQPSRDHDRQGTCSWPTPRRRGRGAVSTAALGHNRRSIQRARPRRLDGAGGARDGGRVLGSASFSRDVARRPPRHVAQEDNLALTVGRVSASASRGESDRWWACSLSTRSSAWWTSSATRTRRRMWCNMLWAMRSSHAEKGTSW